MGFISTGDRYNQKSDKALKRLKGITKIIDDVLIASETYPQHVEYVRELLKRFKEKHITLYRKKMFLRIPKSNLPVLDCKFFTNSNSNFANKNFYSDEFKNKGLGIGQFKPQVNFRKDENVIEEELFCYPTLEESQPESSLRLS